MLINYNFTGLTMKLRMRVLAKRPRTTTLALRER